MANTTTAWLITALTNLHVGDECSTGYGIIDKSVQRNPITKLPCINSSSLKGALNEYFCKELKIDPQLLVSIFGSDKRSIKKVKKIVDDKEVEVNEVKRLNSTKGSAVFFDANLAALPIPTDDDNLYKLISSTKIRTGFDNMCTALGITGVSLSDAVNAENKDDINERCSDESLPIIARNKLDNGVSQNLWYEQVVPQQTVFYTFIQADDDFLKKLENKIVQIGANATIGYGYCKFTKLG